MGRDQRYESWFSQQGVEADYRENVPLSRIDIEASLANQARLGKPLDDELWLKYADAMEQGADFPPLIVYDAGGRLIIVSGNHRVKAATYTSRKSFDLYVVKTDDRYIIERMTRSANVVEGRGLTKDESVAQAVYLVTTFHKRASDVARSFNLKPSDVQKAIERRRHMARLEGLGVKASRMSSSHLDAFGDIPDDKVLKAAVTLAQDYALTSDQAKEMAREIKDKTSEDARYAVVKDWSQRPEIVSRRPHAALSKGGRSTDMPVKTRLLGVLAQLKRLATDYPDVNALQLTRVNEVEETLVMLHDVTNRLDDILRKGRKALLSSVAARTSAKR